METLTVTQARQKLGEYCARALAGEEIGLVWDGRILQLMPVEVVARAPASPNAGSLARWLQDNRLGPEEADAMGKDLVRSRKRIKPARSKWK